MLVQRMRVHHSQHNLNSLKSKLKLEGTWKTLPWVIRYLLFLTLKHTNSKYKQVLIL